MDLLVPVPVLYPGVLYATTINISAEGLIIITFRFFGTPSQQPLLDLTLL
jgi:hypothetical protein